MTTKPTPQLDRICANCGKPEGDHSHVGDLCPLEGGYFSDVRRFEPTPQPPQADRGAAPIPASEWKHYGCAGHLIVGAWCRFHLCTVIGDHMVSTVGEYWPERPSREIHAGVHDPKWLANNKHRKGDDFDAAYMQRFGYEDIGCDRKYETMVFRVIEGKFCECGCGLPQVDFSELEVDSYNDAPAATAGHSAMCSKYAGIAAAPSLAASHRELVEALREIAEMTKGAVGGMHGEIYERAEAALAEAEKLGGAR